jgi:amidase
MRIDEYSACDGTELASLIASGEVSADGVYTAALEAIGAVNPTINAIANGPWEHPLDHAADGVFGGVPFALKDELGNHPAGIRYRCGSRLAGEGIEFPHDTYLMQRIRQAGFATAALTTTPEFSAFPDTVTKVNGATRNPWNPGHTVGGSSGGTAAIVASGALPMAHGMDGGGSIRLPSAWNGVVGLKPSRGRVSAGPDLQEPQFGLSHEFVVTRTIRDCAATLDALAGYMPGDPTMLQRPSRPWIDEVGVAPQRLRIALWAKPLSGIVDPEVATVVDAVARELESQGHSVEPAMPAVDWDEFMSAIGPMGGLGLHGMISAVSAMTGISPGPETLEATSLATFNYGSRLGIQEFLAFLGPQNRIARSIGAFFEDYDLLLSPTAHTAAPPIGFLVNEDDDLDTDIVGWLRTMFERCSTFTPLFNVSGQPAISLPLGQTTTGMPIGVQFVAPMCAEATLFRVAGLLEQTMPWAGRRPPIYASSTRMSPAP